MEKSCSRMPAKLGEKNVLVSWNNIITTAQKFIDQCNNECNAIICDAKFSLVRFLDYKKANTCHDLKQIDETESTK